MRDSAGACSAPAQPGGPNRFYRSSFPSWRRRKQRLPSRDANRRGNTTAFVTRAGGWQSRDRSNPDVSSSPGPAKRRK